MSSRTIRLQAHAKINLSLRVLGRRKDNFHELVSWIQPIDWFDELVVREREKPGISLTCDHPGLSTADDNLVIRAAGALDATIGAAPRGVDVQLVKRIPLGGGLGGGSADAAAMLVALARLRGIDEHGAEVRTAAEAVGSDVPFFLGTGAALVRGRGEWVTPHPRPMTGWAVLIVPPFGVETRRVFAALGAGMLADAGTYVSAEPWARPWHDAAELTRRLDNDLCSAACRVEPRLNQLLSKLRQGDAPVQMSGSGSTMFTLADNEESAAHLALGILQCVGNGATVKIVRVMNTPPIADAD